MLREDIVLNIEYLKMLKLMHLDFEKEIFQEGIKELPVSCCSEELFAVS